MDRIVRELVDAATQVRCRRTYREAWTATLARTVGFDTALVARFDAAVDSPYVVGLPDCVWHAYHAPDKAYRRELAPVFEALRERPISIDTHVLDSRTRERSTFYDHVVRPSKTCSTFLFADLTLGRAPGTLALSLGRAGRGDFCERELQRLARLLPAIGLGEAYWAAPARPSGSSSASPPLNLTARERDVLDYVSLGLSNQQIALALGTSPNTVKHQLASVMSKLGAGTRAEAVRIALSEGALDRTA